MDRCIEASSIETCIIFRENLGVRKKNTAHAYGKVEATPKNWEHQDGAARMLSADEVPVIKRWSEGDELDK